MKTQVMLDLETLGQKPGAVIVSIGAVKFGGGEIRECFYERIDAQSCLDVGLEMDGGTVAWWLRQDPAALLEVAKPGRAIGTVLGLFAEWLGGAEAEVWGNGAAFDNAILVAAYEAIGVKRPWEFRNDRCYRTVKSLWPEVELEREGTHHNALDDAISQAWHLMAILDEGLGCWAAGR